MLEQIQIWLSNIGIQEDLSPILSQVLVLLLLLVGSWVLLLLVQQLVRRGLRNWIEKTDTIWDDIFYRSNFFKRLVNLIPLILVYFTASWFPDLSDWVERISLALIVMIAARSLEAALTAINDIYDDYEVSKSRPIKGYMQVGKIILWLFAIILIISAILRSSPLLLLGGLGAFSAVLLLVFRDTLLGLFASVQFATNDMVRIGDWIEMDQYNADGEVFDITVNTVKVSNWDKTISTIPTHALMENSFKNWRGMELSGGRRIKRALYMDLNTIRFCDQPLLDRLTRIKYVEGYLHSKETEACGEVGANPSDLVDIIGCHSPTNLGAFRSYVIGYLRAHPKINQDMEILVRLLEPTPNGLPLEIYAFCVEKQWEIFEDIQAEIFDHLLAILPEFGLAVYQNPSGVDIQKLQRSALAA